MKDCIGIIPCGGNATRLGKLPCSKELIPVNFSGSSSDKNIKVVSEYLIDSFVHAEIEQIYFVLQQGKWDIPSYYQAGSIYKTCFAYLMMEIPFGVPFTIDHVFPFTENKMVALGFPDMIISPNTIFSDLIETARNSSFDIVLGLFPIEKYYKWDMIEFDSKQNIKSIVIKHNRDDLKYGWSTAVWKPSFSKYLHEKLPEILSNRKDGKIKIDGNWRELYIGDIIQMAMKDGFTIGYNIFNDGISKDIGTPDDLLDAIQMNYSS